MNILPNPLLYTILRRLLQILLIPLTLLAPAEVRAELPSPKIIRVYPLGAQRGTQAELEITGEYLANTTSVIFDCKDITWLKTTSSSSTTLIGKISISRDAPLGPHLLRAVTLDGYSKSALFNVGQFPSFLETELNNKITQARSIPQLPIELQGRLDGASDVDYFSIRVRAGEHRNFDLRSIEYGSGLETKLTLLDAGGHQVAFSDDRSDYDESPWIEHTFTRSGVYFLKVDQYRGPRGFNFGKACTYTLRISSLPRIDIVRPLGLRLGQTTRLHLSGTDLQLLQKVFITPIRLGEYARMTYPYTMPIHFHSDVSSAAGTPTVMGNLLSRSTRQLEVEFTLSNQLEPGLWRLWGSGSQGVSEAGTIEISAVKEYDEAGASQADWEKGEYVIDGILQAPGEKDLFLIRGLAGQPLHFWTLAEQLGLPHLDTVLELRDSSGKKLAESDDVVAGQGNLLGNSDSSLFYTPKVDGNLQLLIKDRLNRGGDNYVYRLKVKKEVSGFQLFTTPENLTVPKGSSAVLKVHLIREAGFEGEVSVWFEGMPDGVEAPKGKFRADQLFEPAADGADMIIPEISFQIQVPDSLPAGDYPIEIFGTSTGEESKPNRSVIEAHTTTLIGPLLDRWNYNRRPLPAIMITVCDPSKGQLSANSTQISLRQGETTTLELKVQDVPETAAIRLMDLPEGITYRELGRQGEQVTLMLEAAPESPPGTAEFTAESRVGTRWISTPILQLQILPLSKISKAGNH